MKNPCTWSGDPQTCHTHGEWAAVCGYEWRRIERVINAAAVLSVKEVEWLAECKRAGFDPVLEIQKLRDELMEARASSTQPGKESE